MPIGIDSQDQGGFNINLWGSAPGLSDHPTNYSEQRADYRLYIGQLKTALGKPFDTLLAEFAGDSGNLPNQTGWTESQIIQDQLQYELNSGWVSLTPPNTYANSYTHPHSDAYLEGYLLFLFSPAKYQCPKN